LKTFCAACRRHITVPDHYVGRAFKCPRCGAMIGQPPSPEIEPAPPVVSKVEPPPSILPAAIPLRIRPHDYQNRRTSGWV
jgi:hypothetical protein